MVSDKQHYDIVLLEIAKHLEDSETSKLSHWEAARIFERRHKFYLGLPATILSLLLTWLLSAQFAQMGFNAIWLMGLCVLVSLLISVCTGLLTFLNFNDLAIRHRTAAENYHALWRDCLNWKTDFPDESNISQAVQMVQQYRRRLCDINRDSPQIPRWAWKSVDRQIKEGSTSYDLAHISEFDNHS